jgi:hypothetical protein
MQAPNVPEGPQTVWPIWKLAQGQAPVSPAVQTFLAPLPHDERKTASTTSAAQNPPPPTRASHAAAVVGIIPEARMSRILCSIRGDRQWS